MLGFTIEQLVLLVLVFLAVTGGVAGVAMIVGRVADVRGRVREVALEFGGERVEPAAGGRLASWMEPFARLARPAEADEISGLRATFMQAGWRGRSVPAVFFGIKTILALVLPLFAFVSATVSGFSLGGNLDMALLLVAAAVGYYAPNVVLAARVQDRRREIFEAFPDATDLVIVCIEAGLGLDAAMARAGRELAVRSPALAEEMELIGTEMRMGATRERALRSFAVRSGVDEISLFVAMVLQADRFGTSIADSLRIHAEELRLRRRLRAEEQAAKIPLKLLFPLIFCIFPSMILVLLGPAFIQIYRTLLPALGGQ